VNNRWNRWIYACWAPWYDLFIGLWPFVRARKRTIEQLNLQPGQRLLIVGIGTGVDLPMLGNDVEVVGIDLSEAMLSAAQRKLDRAPASTQLLAADAERLPFTGRPFDAVLLNLIISVVPDASACLKEVARVCRLGGRMVVLDKFLHDSSPSLGRRAANVVTRVFGTDINRSLETSVIGTGLAVVMREPAIFGDAYELIELQHERC
jgi:ubiquinone/menaquinone biosynthesis C-methylase UbiE